MGSFLNAIFWCYKGTDGEFSSSFAILFLRNVAANKRKKKEEKFMYWFLENDY